MKKKGREVSMSLRFTYSIFELYEISPSPSLNSESWMGRITTYLESKSRTLVLVGDEASRLGVGNDLRL